MRLSGETVFYRGMRLSAVSQTLFDKALQWIMEGEFTSRAFRAVGGNPFFAGERKVPRFGMRTTTSTSTTLAHGGRRFWGTPHVVVDAVNAAEHGTSFGIPNPLEVRMAELVVNAVPSVEKVRMCNSGTEATMSAIRLAELYQAQQDHQVRGCYHGHVDSCWSRPVPVR